MTMYFLCRPLPARTLRVGLLLFCFLATLVLSGCGKGTPVDDVTGGSTGVSIEEAEIQVDLEQDWPWWRGPDGNGLARGTAPTTWSSEENVLWKAEVSGRGHSSPVVCGNLVLLATADDSTQKQSVLAFDRETGDSVWSTVVHAGKFPSQRELHRKGSNANGTVACDGKQIYTAFLNDRKIVATALGVDGKIVWQEELGEFDSKFGYAPSPILYKSAVIFAADNQGGGYISALDRDSGKLIWRKGRPAVSTYSSPVVANLGGRDQLLISGGRMVASYSPETGEENWTCAGTAEATCGTVVWDGDLLFASGGYPERQTVCINAEGKKIWSESQKAYEPSMLAYRGALYCITDDGVAYCWDAKSGKEHWKARLAGGGFSSSPVIADGKIYAPNLQGTTFVFSAATDQYKEVAKNRLGDDTYASPAICGGRIYLRIGEGNAASRREYLVCIGER